MQNDKLQKPWLIPVAALLCLGSGLGQGAPVGTVFTYQGRVTEGGAVATGIYDLRFTVYEALAGGSAVGGPLTNTATHITNGLFTVSLDFGTGVFDGSARWLDIGVRSNGVGNFTTLSPRQPLSPAPYSLYATDAGTAATADSANAVAATNITGTLGLGQLPGTVVTNNAGAVSLTGGFSGNGSGLTNLNAGQLAGGTLPDARLSANVARLAANQAFTGVNTFSPGNVGVGTATPRAGLEIERGTVNAPALRLSSATAGQGSAVWLENRSGGLTNTWSLSASATGPLTLGNEQLQQSALTVATNLNIGIGKTNPATALDVNGTITASSFSGPGALAWQLVSGLSQQAQPNAGYVVNQAAPVTITLPAAPNAGDIVRVSGLGVGGWKLAQNAGQSVFVPGTTTLSLGVNWLPRESNRTWSAVASSADGGKLVAAVNGGLIYTSTDSGVTWSPRESNRIWSAVASSTDGTKLVAAVNGGQIYTSTDSGGTWTPHESSRGWSSVASSSDGTKLVAVVANGQIYTSIDSGVTWTPRGTGASWYSVGSSADGGELVAVPHNGPIYTSTNSGVTWTVRDTSRNWQSVASSADGSKLVAVVSGGQIYTSTDSGVTWTARENSRNWQSVASSADGSKLVAVVNGGQIYTSTDLGMTWTARASNRNWSSVASSADGSKLVAIVSGGQIYTSIAAPVSPSSTTTVGTGGYLTGGQGTAIEIQYVGAGRFLPLSHEGSLFAY